MDNKKLITWLKAIAIAAFFIGAFTLAGRSDYVDSILPWMPQEVYNQIQEKLGGNASDYQVCVYYTKHKDEWKN